MKQKMISATVYWADGRVVSARSRIFLESMTEGQMGDGRPVKLIKGNWVYDPK